MFLLKYLQKEVRESIIQQIGADSPTTSKTGEVNYLSKEIPRTVGGKRLAWLIAIVAAFAVMATLGTQFRSASAAEMPQVTLNSFDVADAAIPTTGDSPSTGDVTVHPSNQPGVLTDQLQGVVASFAQLVGVTKDFNQSGSSVGNINAAVSPATFSLIDEYVRATQRLGGESTQTDLGMVNNAPAPFGPMDYKGNLAIGSATCGATCSLVSVDVGAMLSRTGYESAIGAGMANIASMSTEQFALAITLFLCFSVFVFATYPGSPPLVEKWRISKRFGAPIVYLRSFKLASAVVHT